MVEHGKQWITVRLNVVTDFNSPSQGWEYQHLGRRGEEAENWQDENRLLLINSYRPVFLKLNLGASTEATVPWWKYKKANWTQDQHSLQGHHRTRQRPQHDCKGLQLVHTQDYPGNNTKGSKKKLQILLESRTTRPPGCTVRSQRGS